MFNKSATNNKSYFMLSGLLCFFVLTLNYTTTIAQCALIFSAIVTIVSLIVRESNRNKAILAMFVATMFSMAVSYNMQYYIHGNLVSNLVVASLVALYISVHGSVSILSSMKLDLDFKSFNLLLVIIAGLLDAVMMSVFFALNNHFAISKILSIATQEVSYKALYALSIYMFCVLAKRGSFSTKI